MMSISNFCAVCLMLVKRIRSISAGAWPVSINLRKKARICRLGWCLFCLKSEKSEKREKSEKFAILLCIFKINKINLLIKDQKFTKMKLFLCFFIVFSLSSAINLDYFNFLEKQISAEDLKSISAQNTSIFF